MTKQELVDAVAESAGLTKANAAAAVDAVFEAITAALADGDQVSMVGFGTFKVRERAARKGRNPQTNEEIEIAASKVPAFTAGKKLKDAVK
ncbi:MAG: HU family DNA-binding protein [Armatimonadetes bacterium]|nr:HU family DNA-binding protein [Armatimonadota bacterium]NLN88557.1 HU family DNA-binding protein [candidate division WS1 bacterium]